MRTHEKPKAARLAPDGSPGKFDHVWRKIRAECNREAAKEQITSSPIDHPLPMVRAALERDRLTRLRMGAPPNTYEFLRRPGFDRAIASHEFAAAKRCGRGRGTR